MPGCSASGNSTPQSMTSSCAVELEDGHVAADLAEPAERHDAQTALGQRRRGLEIEVRLGDLPLIGCHSQGDASGGEVDAQLRELLGRRVDQRRPHRAGRQAERVAAPP